jgi:DUF971 family protein
MERVLGIAAVQKIGSVLAVKWSDGREDCLDLRELRKACPCATCAGERDLTGGEILPKADPAGFHAELTGWEFVGGYGFQPHWADGHRTGIYTFQFLRSLGEPAPRPRCIARMV